MGVGHPPCVGSSLRTGGWPSPRGQLVDPARADLHVRLYIERHFEAYAELHIRLYTHTEAANLFFQLVSARYERASVIVTSNKPFG